MVKGAPILVVGRNDFIMEHSARPLWIHGVHSEKGWPFSIETWSTHFLLDAYDLCHFILIGEAHPLSFEWWRKKFRGGDNKKDTDMRQWERVKKRFRDSGVPFSLADPDTGEFISNARSSSHTVSTAMSMKFDRFRFVPVVQSEIDIRQSIGVA